MSDIITNIHTYDQPIETSVKVGIEVDSKGQRKPSVEIRITRHVGINEADKFYGRIMDDIQLALSRCQDTINKSVEV